MNFRQNSKLAPTTAEIDSIIKMTIRTPTGFNLQPYTVVLLSSDDVAESDSKEKIAADAAIGPANGKRMSDCSLLAVFLTDLDPSGPDRIGRILEIEEGDDSPRREADGYLSSLPMLTSFLTGTTGTQFTDRFKSAVLDGVSEFGGKASVESEGVRAWGNKSVGMAIMTFVYG